METTETIRRGIINQGAFFSPYYLFDLLARQHADELDPEGRKANRRLLRRPFRNAWARYRDSGSSPGQAWQSWHRELFEALGFDLQRLETPVETSRHGLVPISHGAYADGDDSPLVVVDLHGFGTDLDRDHYSAGGAVSPDGQITEETIARALEFALDSSETRWAVVGTGNCLRLYRKGGSVARQYLEVNLPALFDADRNDEWAAFWGLFRYEAFLPDAETNKCLLDRVLEESQRHASKIAEDLRDNVVLAVEALIQGILDAPANRDVIGPVDQKIIEQLFEESLYFLYRLLFVLYAESRDLLPVGESPVYRDTYSVEQLREMAERPLHSDDAQKTYYIETLRALFEMLHQGFPPPNSALNPGFEISAFNGQLFDPQRTVLLDRCHIPDRAMREVIRELSLSRPRRRRGRRARYSYADLGVDQLGSIYEGLLVYEPTIVTEETVVAKVKGDDRLVNLAQAEEYGLQVVEDSLKRPGSFVLRLWGGRRKGTGSYYTPQEITTFLVREALEPLVEPIVQHCGERNKRDRPKRRPEEILEIKVCDPAMGSGAFLIQACRYLAEAYGRARIAAGLDEDERISQEEFSHYKRRVAEKCLYGVDLNPLAVELAKVSLWLEGLSRDRPLTFLDAHLRCGNALIGAPLRDEKGHFTVEPISTVPNEALKEVSKEATKEQKAAAAARIKRNREELKRLQPQKAGQAALPGDWGVLALREIEAAMADTLTRRLDLEESDEDLPSADAVELVYAKEELFEQLQHAIDSRYRRARQMCNLWCSVWFWPEVGTEIEVERDNQTRTVVVPEPPTTQVYLELAGFILGSDPGSLTEAERETYLLTAEHVAEEQRFFHWELEFPEVWREKNGRLKKNGGFDAQVGNPPWAQIKFDPTEFFLNWNSIYDTLPAQDAQAWRSQALAQDAVIRKARSDSARFVYQCSHFLRNSSVYQAQFGGRAPDLYRAFAERGIDIARKHGRIAILLPGAFYALDGSAALRRKILSEVEVQLLVSTENRNRIFPIDSRRKIVCLVMKKGGKTTSFPARFFRAPGFVPGKHNLQELLATSRDTAVILQTETLKKYSPHTMAMREFRTQRDAEIYGKLHARGRLFDEVCKDGKLELSQSFNRTVHKGRLNTVGKGIPIITGRCVHQFTIHYSPPECWIEPGKIAGAGRLAETLKQPVLAYRKTARSTDELTLIASVVPTTVGTDYKLNLIIVRDTEQFDIAYLAGWLNSLAMNYCIRQYHAGTDINQSTTKQLPLPTGAKSLEVTTRVLALVSPAAISEESVAGYDSLAFPPATDPRERAQSRAEIDALIADACGLSEEDFAYILTTFPLLDRDQPALPGEPKSFITRDLALLALFKLRAKTPPSDIVDFFAGAGADTGGITGQLRDLEQRVVEATRLGAMAYIPTGRGGAVDLHPEEPGVQYRLFEEERNE